MLTGGALAVCWCLLLCGLSRFDPVQDLGLAGQQQQQQSGESSLLQAFHRKHRSARSRWMVPDSFPDPAVFKAYLAPTVGGGVEREAQGSQARHR